jgi:hypothetical protein
VIAADMPISLLVVDVGDDAAAEGGVRSAATMTASLSLIWKDR